MVFLSRIYTRGGDGGDTFSAAGSQGGDGLVVHVDSTARLLNTRLLGGAPGMFSSGTFGLPLIGLATVIPGS